MSPLMKIAARHGLKVLEDCAQSHGAEYKDKMTGIGAPNATAVFEELIALGGKEFINVGTAGGLHHEGIFLCNKALRDEGTSHHYLPNGKFTYPDEKLTKKLGRLLEKNTGMGVKTSTRLSTVYTPKKIRPACSRLSRFIYSRKRRLSFLLVVLESFRMRYPGGPK